MNIVFPLTNEKFFQNVDHEGVNTTAEGKDITNDASLEQEETRANEVVAEDDWIARPTAVIREHKVSSRRFSYQEKGQRTFLLPLHFRAST